MLANLLCLSLLPAALAAPSIEGGLEAAGDIEIVGGVKVDSINTYPFIGSISIYGSRHSCGGTMIAPNLFMTAAHCSQGSPSSRKVTAWRYDLSKSVESEGSVKFEVETMVTHPKYRTERGVPMDDISIWVLKEVSNPQKREMQYADWATSKDEPDFSDKVRVIGWGTTRESGSISNVLLQVDVTLVNNTECAKEYGLYPNSIRDFSLCAGEKEGGKDACQGDSGGPLFREVDGKAVLYGVTSWGRGCAREGYPGVYTRVGYYGDWIKSVIEKYSA